MQTSRKGLPVGPVWRVGQAGLREKTYILDSSV